MRQVKDSPMRRAIKQGMTVLKFMTSHKPSGRNQRKNRTPLKSSTAQSGCVGGALDETTPGKLPQKVIACLNQLSHKGIYNLQYRQVATLLNYSSRMLARTLTSSG